MARKGNTSKLPDKEKVAAKLVAKTGFGVNPGFIVIYNGEELVMYEKEYGSFKKLLAAAIKMQKSDPYFTWVYKDFIEPPKSDTENK